MWRLFMPTPLFPADNQRVIIKQGKVGNCYLLAGLDCVLNEMQGGRALAKQRFVQYPDGSVRVQIPRNSHSPHLNPAVIGSKYILDQSDPNFDYWHIPKSEIDRMDAAGGKGAESNCLAVKIMERLSSYYFVKPPKTAGIGESLIAHDHKHHGERYTGTAPAFVANLMGVHVDQMFGSERDRRVNFDRNIDKLIRLKQMDPNAPVYLELDWGEPDAHGRIHGRHAVRVEKIVPDGRGSYNVHIVNPWDNSTASRKVFNIADLKFRDSWFSHYSPSPQHSALTETLLACRTAGIGRYVYANPNLMNTLITFQNKAPHLANNPQIIELLVNTCANNPQLVPVIDKLLSDPTQAGRLATNIQQSQMREDYLVRSIVSQLFHHPEQSAQRLFDSLPIRLTGPVLRDMAVDAKYRRDVNLQQYFSSPDFMKRLMDGAINEVASDPRNGGDKSLARSQIEHELVHYYISNDKRYLVNNNIRAFVDAGIVDVSTVLPRVLSAPTMLSKSLNYFLNSGQPIGPGLTNYFKTLPLTEINPAFIDDFFTKARCSNPQRLCDDLYKLSATNPQLASHLLAIGRERINAFYPGAFERFVQAAKTSGSADFSNWLDANANKQERIDAQKTIDSAVTMLDSVPVHYPDITNATAIKQHANYLRDLLGRIAKRSELEEAKRVLVMTRNPPEIQRVLDAKMGAVTALEEMHLQAIKQQAARNTIDAYVKKIKDFPFNPDGLNTQQLEKRAIDLRAILNEDAYIRAKRDLGLREDPQVISSAFVAKAQVIDAAIERRLKEDHVHANNTILGEANIIIDRVRVKGADAVNQAIKQLQKQFNDPYHDGLFRDKEKNELLRDIANLGFRKGVKPQLLNNQNLKLFEDIRLPQVDPSRPLLNKVDFAQLAQGIRIPQKDKENIEALIQRMRQPRPEDKLSKCLKEIEAVTISYPAHTAHEIRDRRNDLLREIKNIREKPEYHDVKNLDAVDRAVAAKVAKINDGAQPLLIAAYEKKLNDFPKEFKEKTLSGVGTEARAQRQDLRIAYKQAQRDFGISKPLPSAVEEAFQSAKDRLDKAERDYKNGLNHCLEKNHHHFKTRLKHAKHELHIFDRHLEEIEKMVDRLKDSPSKQEKYGHAEQLRNTLVEARNEFVQHRDMKLFSDKCIDAIDKAMPHLQKHEKSHTGIKILDAIIDFFKEKLTTTKSAELVEEVTNEVRELSRR